MRKGASRKIDAASSSAPVPPALLLAVDGVEKTLRSERPVPDGA